MRDTGKESGRERDELVEEARRKDEFLATLGHELRNALAPLRNAVDLIRLVGHEPTTRGHVSGILDRQIAHMTRLVDDLLDVARISRGQLEVQAAPVDLVAVVTQAVESRRPLVEGHGHRLEVSLPEAPLPVDADVVRITQVISNLLDNAAKFTPAGGNVRVSAEQDGDSAVVRVRDDGVGIPAEQLATVFAMFSQGERAASKAGGLGIGLALARRLVELHRGTLTACSTVGGEGTASATEMIIRLPLGSVGPSGDAGGESDGE